MGYFANQVVEIMDRTYYGDTPEAIAKSLGLSVEQVLNVIEAYGESDIDPGEMDGDFDSAMASAGFGTDEDYGYYGDE